MASFSLVLHDSVSTSNMHRYGDNEKLVLLLFPNGTIGVCGHYLAFSYIFRYILVKSSYIRPKFENNMNSSQTFS